MNKEKSEEKRISVEAYDINMQTICIAPNQKSNQGHITPLSPYWAITVPVRLFTSFSAFLHYDAEHCREDRQIAVKSGTELFKN